MIAEKIILSIVVPIYNVDKYLNKCLDSIVKQDTTGVEIILVNDGSNDKSEEICLEYLSKYNNIKLINQSNSGLSVARNTGINNSRGEYILFLDSDDWLNDNALEKIKFEISNNNSVDVILGKNNCYDESTGNVSDISLSYKAFNKSVLPDELFYDLIKRNNFWFAAWLCIVNRNFIIDNNLFFLPNIFHEDELWVPQIMIMANSISLMNFDFYCYRINRIGSIISEKNIKKELDKLIIIDNLIDFKSRARKTGKKIIKDRIAAMEWGLINKFKYYSDNVRQNELFEGIKKRLNCLKHKKYYLVYFYIKLFSLKKVLNR